METAEEKRTRQYGSRGLGLIADQLAEVIHEVPNNVGDIQVLTEMIAFAYGVVKIEYETCIVVEDGEVIVTTHKED